MQQLLDRIDSIPQGKHDTEPRSYCDVDLYLLCLDMRTELFASLRVLRP